jgi:hypothetical protein
MQRRNVRVLLGAEFLCVGLSCAVSVNLVRKHALEQEGMNDVRR